MWMSNQPKKHAAKTAPTTASVGQERQEDGRLLAQHHVAPREQGREQQQDRVAERLGHEQPRDVRPDDAEQVVEPVVAGVEQARAARRGPGGRRRPRSGYTTASASRTASAIRTMPRTSCLRWIVTAASAEARRDGEEGPATACAATVRGVRSACSPGRGEVRRRWPGAPTGGAALGGAWRPVEDTSRARRARDVWSDGVGRCRTNAARRTRHHPSVT